MLMPGKGFVSLSHTMPRGAQIWPEMPDLITHYSPCQGLAPARVDTEPVSVIFDWVRAQAELFITWRHNMGNGETREAEE